MNSDDRVTVWVIGMFAGLIATLVLTVGFVRYNTYKVMAERGYSQVMVVGSCEPVWTAPDKERSR